MKRSDKDNLKDMIIKKTQFLKNKINKGKKSNSSQLSIMDIGSIFLRILKLMSDFFYVIVLFFAFLGMGIGFGYFASQIDDVEIPDKDTLIADVSSLTSISKMTFSDDSLISTINTDLLRTPVGSDAISENIKNAIIATEDENFMIHKGVVPKAVFRATLTSVLGIGETSGGSTITQQLLKQQVLGDDPTFKRKAKEIIYALSLERYMNKDDILTKYLNVSPFGRNNKGQNIAGIEEAAQGIFGVSAKDLTIPQSAFLAGLPQSPIVYSPYTSTGEFKTEEDMTIGLKRAQNVLYSMYRTGQLSKADYESYKAYDLRQDFRQPETIIEDNHDYLYYTVLAEAKDIMYDYLVKKDGVSEQDLKNDNTKQAYEEKALKTIQLGGYTIQTTINKTVHNAMQEAARNHGGLLDDETGQVQMGNVLLDNKTGAVIGFIGGRDYNTNQNNHAFDTYRSPGSSIKPILAYAPAIDQGLMGSASILSNYPTTFSSGQKIMHGVDEGTSMVTLQEALNTSWNIPAFWTYQMLLREGVDVKGYMEKMNYHVPYYDIESLPLGGGIETSVVQQTNAYQAIANNGIFLKKYIVSKITDAEGNIIFEHQPEPIQIYSKGTANIMASLLRGPIVSGVTTTFASRLRSLNNNLLEVDWIGKTGTTNETSDVWLMLATPSVSLGSWAGHDDNSSLADLTGYNNHANYVAHLVTAINNADPKILGPSEKFTIDPSVIQASVLNSTGLKPGSVSINGRTINVGGTTTSSLWAKNGPGVTTYKFAIGGTDNDYAQAWAKIIDSNPKPSSKPKEEKTQKEDNETP